ncbi:hypothetical protein ACQF36_27520 [Streptomyces sp. Marseille-Q5077]|uniref:hypothetical protein n=1 Tax=Streptomyces sp. Marseille-Q5077 TaxID=3418995 RepID=UPI003D040ED9
MSADELTPPEAARWAARAGLSLDETRHTGVAATAQHIHSVVSVLRELDFGDTPPASAFDAGRRTGEERHDAAV